MSIRQICKNLRTKGFKETYRIHRVHKCEEGLYGYATNRPYGNLPLEKRHKALEKTIKWEQTLEELDPKKYKKFKKWLKPHYLKEVIPQRYAELVQKCDVKDKVVFMEKYGPTTPSNKYISKVLQEEGKYEVVKIGLDKNHNSDFGIFENVVHLVEEMADAKAICISSANQYLSHVEIRPETKFIQLWHGCGCFKKVGYSTLDSNDFGRSEKNLQEYEQYHNYSYVCLPAEDQKWVFEDAMRIPRDSGKLVPVGVSRTDQFYDPEYSKAAREKLEEKFPQIAGKKIIFYAPTYRGRISKAYTPNQLDVSAMGAALSDEYVLLIKYHSFGCKTRPALPEEYANSFAFDMNANGILDIESLLAISDILITDYSSVGFEFAILERPIVFFAYDKDQYLDERGMYYDYEEITPGPICTETEEIISYIESLKDGFDDTEIKKFKEQYVKMCDGHATERTIALFDK